MPGPREESGMKDKGSHLPALCPEVWMVAGESDPGPFSDVSCPMYTVPL